MSTPREPDDHDALWREIVEHYGERADLGDVPEPAPAPIADPPAHPESEPAPEGLWHPTEEEHYVPPPPPPVGWPRGPRALAWFGVFGGPAIIVVLVLFKQPISTLLGWAVLFGFIGGFGFLIASMRPREDGWDDGAQI